MRNTFLFWLFNALRKAMYIDDAGNIAEADGDLKKPDGQPAHLLFDPDGWENVSAKFVRNEKYWGLFRDMLTPLRFVKDGYAILIKQIGAFGFECIVHLGIQKLDRLNLPYEYQIWQISELNFAKYVEEETHINIDAVEGGPSKYIKAFENTDYEISIDTDPEHINVLFDGLTLFQKGSYTAAGTINNDFLGNIHTVPLIFIQNEGDTGGTIYDSQAVEEIVNLNDYLTTSNNNYITNNTGAVKNYHLHGEIKFKTIKNDVTGSAYRLDLFKSTGVGSQDTIASFLPMVVDEITTVPVDKIFSLNDGESMFLVDQFHGAFPGGSIEIEIEYLETSFLYVEFEAKFKNTYVKGHYPKRVAQLILEQMTGGLYTIKSTLLDNMKDTFITCGDALRGIITDNSDPANPIRGARIKTSWAKFVKSMNHFGIASGVQGDFVVIEKMQDFFTDDVIADIGQVTGAKKAVAENIIFNTLKTGGPVVEYSDVNGKFEPNQEQQWSMPITKVIKEGDFTTDYRRDPYGAEFARINLEGLTTTDDKSDNDTWMINIETVKQTDNTLAIDYYNLNRPAFVSITGVPDTVGIFNLLFTPKWTLINNGGLINSICDKLDSKYITMTTAEKNRDLKTVGTVVMDEDEPIQIASLAAKLFQPYYFTFVTEVPLNLLTVLDVNPYGKIKFRWNNRDWYGYIMDISIKPAINDKQTWKLIAAPNQDLSKFNKV